MKTKFLFAFLFAIALVAQPAFAWNPHGHRVIASLAFMRLEPAKRLMIAQKIRKHPRFEKDFIAKMPERIRAAGEQMQAEWIFQQAAVWPDTTRSLTGAEEEKYNHGTWHYVDKITYLNSGDEEAIGEIEMNLSTVPPQSQAELMNAVQTIGFARLRVTGAVKVSEEQEALMLCWLLHSISDLHQPCHSTEIFSKTLLPDGCNGANLIMTKQARNLHALWDGLLGNDDAFQACHNQAIKMLADEDLAQVGRNAAPKNSAVEIWNQSHDVALKSVYADEVIAHLKRLESAGETVVAEIDLTQAYLEQAGRIANRQASRAGWRIAKVLE